MSQLNNGVYKPQILSVPDVSGLVPQIERIDSALETQQEEITDLQEASEETGTLEFTYYYQLYLDVNNTPPKTTPVFSSVQFSPEGESFSGIATFKMSNSQFTEFTDDILTFVSFRTPPNATVEDGYYKETFDILLPDNSYVTATSVYKDSGSGLATTTGIGIRFVVTGARGRFKGIKSVLISFNQKTNTRTMYFYS